MTGEVTTGTTLPQWSNLPTIPECWPLQNLYQNVLKIQGGTSEKLNALLDKVVSQRLHNSTDHSGVLNELVFSLAKLALNVANVADILISSMEKYEYPEGKTFKNNVYDYIFWQHHENVLPRCDFKLDKPLNRERFVVCKQMINYFAELISTEIFRMCPPHVSDLSQLPFKVQNFGSYLVYSEDSHTKTSGRHFNSWEIRKYWEIHMRENFCTQSENTYWRNTLCSGELPEETSPESLVHWKTKVYPGAYKQGDVYSSITATEIDSELSRQNAAQHSHKKKAFQMQAHFREELTSAANNLNHARTVSAKIITIFDKMFVLKTLKETYDEKRSLDNWKVIQNHARAMQAFLAEHGLENQYPDIEYEIQLVFRIIKPKQNIEL